MKIFKFFGFILKSVTMGMIAALFLYTFFPQVFDPQNVANSTESQIQEPLSFASGIKRAAPSVVKINTFSPNMQTKNQQPTAKIGVGSGVIISPQGYIVTNYHVISEAAEIAVELSDGRAEIAKVVGFDVESDLAILQISLKNLPAIVMDPNIKVEVGDIALVIGNPFGVGQAVTMGIVSATGRRFLGLSEYENYIQTDAAVNHGNSGGAMINSRGDLLGISSSYFTYGTKTGISFAIPTSMVMDISEQIIFNGYVIRGWLGFTGGPIDLKGRKKFGDYVYLVEGVNPEGPAGKAGLKAGDILVSIDDRTIKSATELHNIIAESEVGTEIEMRVIRNERAISLTAVVQERPTQGPRKS